MADFIQQRHKPPAPLDRPRELVVACPPMRSNVNLSRIVRAAGCCGVRRMICCGNAKVIAKIARDAAETLHIEVHRTLPPMLEKLRQEGFEIVGLEQTTQAKSIFEFPFQRRTVLVVGNERIGIDQRGAAAFGPCGGDSGLRSALRPQRGHRRRHGPLRILPAVSAGIAPQTTDQSLAMPAEEC